MSASRGNLDREKLQEVIRSNEQLMDALARKDARIKELEVETAEGKLKVRNFTLFRNELHFLRVCSETNCGASERELSVAAIG